MARLGDFLRSPLVRTVLAAVLVALASYFDRRDRSK